MSKRMTMAASGTMILAALAACFFATLGTSDNSRSQPALMALAGPGNGLGQLQPAPSADRRTGQNYTAPDWMPSRWNCRTCSVPIGDPSKPLWPKPAPRPLDAAAETCAP